LAVAASIVGITVLGAVAMWWLWGPMAAWLITPLIFAAAVFAAIGVSVARSWRRETP
jgi:hypothetical protein